MTGSQAITRMGDQTEANLKYFIEYLIINGKISEKGKKVHVSCSKSSRQGTAA